MMITMLFSYHYRENYTGSVVAGYTVATLVSKNNKNKGAVHFKQSSNNGRSEGRTCLPSAPRRALIIPCTIAVQQAARSTAMCRAAQQTHTHTHSTVVVCYTCLCAKSTAVHGEKYAAGDGLPRGPKKQRGLFQTLFFHSFFLSFHFDSSMILLVTFFSGPPEKTDVSTTVPLRPPFLFAKQPTTDALHGKTWPLRRVDVQRRKPQVEGS